MTISSSVAMFIQIQKNKEKTKKEAAKYTRTRPRDLYKNQKINTNTKPFNFLEYAKNNPGFLELLSKK